MESNQINQRNKTLSQANTALLDEAEALIWAMIDDNIKPADSKRLEALLQENEQVRQRYFSCTQMHTDLQQHFDEIPARPATDCLPTSPVLGQLGDSRPGTVSLPPVPE